MAQGKEMEKRGKVRRMEETKGREMKERKRELEVSQPKVMEGK